MNEQDQVKLAAYIAQTFYDDPVGYFKAVLGFDPDDWQQQAALSVRDNRRTAIRSGHGTGKTRLSAALIHWFMATRSYPRIRATANTEKQVMSVLWAEVATVNRNAKNKDMFEFSRTSFRLKSAPETHFAEAIAWSENNSEAFAGIHAQNVLYIFDEASAIADIIWEVSQGAMTGEGARWLVVGNPTRNTGKFHECFGRNKAMTGETDSSKWNAFTVSCFDSPRVEQSYIDEIEREYGKDSDPYRVRVLGLPPMQEEQQFISVDLYDGARLRAPFHYPDDVRVLSCDPARFGDDTTVIGDRKGRNARILKRVRGQDLMSTAGDLMHYIQKAAEAGEAYDYVVVDPIGLGAGIIDRLREQGISVIEVNVSGKPHDPLKYKNLTSELWDKMKTWLEVGSITEDFRDDLVGRQYAFDSGGRLVLERKEDMKKRGLASPDAGDMLAMTFYVAKVTRQVLESGSPTPDIYSGELG